MDNENIFHKSVSYVSYHCSNFQKTITLIPILKYNGSDIEWNEIPHKRNFTKTQKHYLLGILFLIYKHFVINGTWCPTYSRTL